MTTCRGEDMQRMSSLTLREGVQILVRQVDNAGIASGGMNVGPLILELDPYLAKSLPSGFKL